MEKIKIKPKTYKNIIELATENNLLDKWNQVVEDGDGRDLKQYLEEYSDRPIVFLFLCDELNNSPDIDECRWHCSKKKNWEKVEITVDP